MSAQRRCAVDLVVLDIAGTTVQEDGAVYVALDSAIRQAGVTPTDEQLASWMGADKREAITSALTTSSEGRPATGRVDTVYADFRRRLLTAYAQSPPRPFAGVPEAIAALRARDVRVALSTGFTREITDHLLETIGWQADVVDTVVCAEDVGAGRPKPYMIFEAMRRLRVEDVRRVLVAGDTARDLQAGNNAGAGWVVGVLTGAYGVTALGATRHTHLLQSAADIPRLLS